MINKKLNQFGAYVANSFMIFKDGQKVKVRLYYGMDQNNDTPAIYPDGYDLVDHFGDYRVHGCHNLGCSKDYYISHEWSFPELEE